MDEEITANNVILGMGAAGAIAACAMPGSLVVTKDLYREDYQRGPLWLYYTEEVWQFLDNIDVAWSLDEVRFGWVHEKKIVPPSPKVLRAYHYKVRGKKPTKAWMESHQGDSFKVADIHFPELFWTAKKMSQEVLKDAAIEVDIIRKQIKTNNGKTINYNTLVSTLPMPVFSVLSGLPESPDASWKPIWMKRFKGPDSSLVCGIDIFDTHYNYLNIVDKGTAGLKTYRVTRHGSDYDAEYLWEPLGAKCIHYGKMLSGSPLAPITDVTFLGRWAEWKDGLKLHNIVERFM